MPGSNGEKSVGKKKDPRRSLFYFKRGFDELLEDLSSSIRSSIVCLFFSFLFFCLL